MVKKLIGPILSLVLLILGNGLFNTFVSVSLEMQGFDAEVIGIVTSALYAGILVGSWGIDRWISRVGHARAMMVFAGVSGVLVLLQGLWLDPVYWGALRFLGGICMAGVFVAIESWFLLQSTPATRSAALSLYVGVFYAALSSGQLLIHWCDLNTFGPFLLVSALSFASIVPLMWSKIETPKLEQTTRLPIWELARRSPLGFAGGVMSGIVLATTYGLIPVFAKERGLTVPDVGNLMAVIIFGGLSLQWPLGKLADKLGRKKVLQLVSLLSLGCSVGMSIMHPDHVSFLVLAWMFGGVAFGLYPLSMAYTCEHVEEKEIVPATGSFVLAYGLGAIAGPLLAPLAMDGFGAHGVFYFLAGVFGFLGSVGLVFRAAKKEVEE